MDPQKIGAQHAQQYTPQQKQALERLHTAATQLEGVFLDMLFSAMRQTVPQQSIFGKQSNAEQTFQSMLDEQRSQKVAQSGSMGIAKVLEEQLKQSVLADASREAKSEVPRELEP
ncbi:MAG TPA: rod-binding protein [Candidatus Baltobacteraceae bacterium]|nr:rod-binding protein [Candidatus Baltobacteraceae bacterium]